MNEPTQPGRDPGEAPLHSDAWRLQGIFFEPSQTFKEIRQRPGWILPLIAFVLLGLLSFNYLLSTVGPDTVIRRQLEQSPQFRDADPEQRAQMIERSGFLKIFMRVAPLLAFLALLVMTGLFFGVLLLTGKEVRFKRVFSVVCHSFYATGLISSVLMVIVTALAEDPGAIDLQNPLQTNLGFLADSSSRAQTTFLSSLDILTFYRIYLLSLGFSTTTRGLSMGGGVGIVGGLWLVYVVLATGASYLFGG